MRGERLLAELCVDRGADLVEGLALLVQPEREPRFPLADHAVLRHSVGLEAREEGIELGEVGAATVAVDSVHDPRDPAHHREDGLGRGVLGKLVARQHFGRVDPGPVVLDEVAGMLITLALIPVTVTGAIVGFLLFRVLDVIKPWPANRFEALPGGLGVMADDAMAAVYGNVIMRVLIVVTPAGWLA